MLDPVLLKYSANFLFEVGLLAKTPRSGFRFLGGNYKQSVSEHLLRTEYIGYVLAHLERIQGEDVDVHRVTMNCRFHDLGEARASDLDYVSQQYSSSDELKAIKDAVKQLPFGAEIIESFLETEGRTSLEGTIAKDADQLEFLLALKENIDSGNVHAPGWIDSVVQRLQRPISKALAEIILASNANEWWYGSREADYWVRGGKTPLQVKD